ncbi:MAG: TonB-dependent receptor [Bacteroidales bacterium]|nr:TonB-dependent receptor [Bacteroidota bacterium]MBL6949591.1 TonB-dependent receptor [Bacteroidales bacterium]
MTIPGIYKHVGIILITGVLFLLTSTIGPGLQGQSVHGFVYEHNDRNQQIPLVGVNVYWLGTTQGAFTDAEGNFVLPAGGITDHRLVFSLLGFGKDTIAVSTDLQSVELEMHPDELLLGEVEVVGRIEDSYLSRLNTQYTQVITGGELDRAACCNLAESFETNASVDVSYSDAISGARQIQLLGLSGLYSQIMAENVPLISGLAAPYGLSYIPGPWMESIQISKGSSTVANGYESITGQINVEYKKPEESEKLFLNLYGNSNLRVELNGNGTIRINDKLSTMLLIQGSDRRHKFDRNDDGFMDLPLSTTLTAMNRWDFINPGKFSSRFAVKYLYEDRNGGQMAFNRKSFTFDTSGISNNTKKYGIGITTNRLEMFWKNRFLLGQFGNTSMDISFSGINHQQDGFYGINKYHGHEQRFHAMADISTGFNENMHKISAGLNYSLDNYSENYTQHQLSYEKPLSFGMMSNGLFPLKGDTLVNFNMDRTEWVAGAFIEYTFDLCPLFILIAGVRVDYNNLYGVLFTPRLHLRHQINESLIIRGSVGKGYRTANLLAENSNLFVSQRIWHMNESLDQEEAWNFGFNLTKDFNLFKRDAQFVFDIYQTSFVNQVIVDVDSIPTEVFFYNLDGNSYAISLQAQVTVRPIEGFLVTAAFRFNDVKVTEGGRLKTKAMVNAYKGLLTLSYNTLSELWNFDLTGQLNGSARLPESDKLPEEFKQSSYSPAWFNLMAQVSRKINKFEIYVGGENLTNFRQPDPIRQYEAPYRPYFDGSMVWGPMTGISVYAGVRFTIK